MQTAPPYVPTSVNARLLKAKVRTTLIGAGYTDIDVGVSHGLDPGTAVANVLEDPVGTVLEVARDSAPLELFPRPIYRKDGRRLYFGWSSGSLVEEAQV